MTPETRDAAFTHAVSEYPREACGLVVIVKGRERYWPCVNQASTPSEHFVLAPADYAAADDAGEITIIVHSHPDAPARPSEADRVACEASGLPWAIVSVAAGENGLPAAGEMVMIEPCGYRAPLVGRPFSHGVLDCWALCRDWYEHERGVVLLDPPRHDNWWDDGVSDLYCDAALHAAGFEIVWRNGADALPELEPGDVLLMQVRSRNQVPNHAGIYLGDGLMLHHMPGRLSSRDVFGGYWLECLRKVARLDLVGQSARGDVVDGTR